MKRHEARKILEDWMSNYQVVNLPIVDQVIHTSQKDMDSREVIDWTFKGLIKIAYDLQEFDDK